MKKLQILFAFTFSLSFVHAQSGTLSQPATITSSTVFEWDPVTTTTDGDPLVIRTYTVGVFALSSSTPLFVVNSATTSGAFGLLMTNLTPSVKYETRVMAEAQDGLKSPWSDPFYVARSARQMSPPKNVRLKL